MLLELAIGDAYGAGFEFVPLRIVNKLNNLKKYIVNRQKNHRYKPGDYTDDTQMSIAIAELILEDRDFTPLNIADKFVECFKRDERKGYATRFYYFLKEISSGKEFLQKINSDSEKNLAAMRSSLIGLFKDERQVIEYARIQAELTNNTAQGKNSAIAVSLMSHFFAYNIGKKQELPDYLKEKTGVDFSMDWCKEVNTPGYEAVFAAVTAIKKSSSLSKILRKCINLGGDTDTTASIAMSCASLSREILHDIPNVLMSGLENNAFGRNYLIGLDRKLEKKFALKNITRYLHIEKYSKYIPENN